MLSFSVIKFLLLQFETPCVLVAPRKKDSQEVDGLALH